MKRINRIDICNKIIQLDKRADILRKLLGKMDVIKDYTKEELKEMHREIKKDV